MLLIKITRSFCLLFVCTVSQFSKSATLDSTFTQAIGGVSTTSWTHRIGAGGTNRLLIVNVVTSSRSISTVNCGSTAMTLFGSSTQNGMVAAMYYLVAPAVGAHTISVTLTGNSNMRVGSVSYFGVNQTVPLQDLFTSRSLSPDPAVVFNSDAGTAVVLFAGGKDPLCNTTTQVYEIGTGRWNNFSTTPTIGIASLQFNMGNDDWIIVAGLLNSLAVLPLSIGSLQAIPVENQHVKIRWTVPEVQNATRMYLERGTDGILFGSRTEITLRKTGSTYEHLDANLPAEKFYYRICILTSSGQYIYSKVAVANVAQQNTAVISPNPCQAKLQIHSAKSIQKAILYDAGQKEILRTIGNSDLDLSLLKPGIYFLHLYDADGNIEMHKVLHN